MIGCDRGPKHRRWQRPDWDEVAALVNRGYQLIAPKRLAAMVD